jgi:hypothetical protein
VAYQVVARSRAARAGVVAFSWDGRLVAKIQEANA